MTNICCPASLNTEKTRGKDRKDAASSSRPRAVLFEGPPGTGKAAHACLFGL